MAVMVIHRPTAARRLPDLRLDLLRAWRSDGPLAVQAAVLIELGSIRAIGGSSHADPRVFAAEVVGSLQRSDLWWVTTEMCELVEHAAPTVPDDTVLEPAFVGTEHALVVFARPLVLTNPLAHGPLHIDALSWSLADSAAGRLVACRFYRWIGDDPADTEEYPAARAVLTELHTNLLFLSGSEWLVGTAITEPTGLRGAADTASASSCEDRNLIACLWLLASQPGIASVSTTTADKQTRRRSERVGLSSDVRLVALRGGAASTGDGDGATRGPMAVRVPVEGYWRSQPYGPGGQYRRPQYIAPHIRGPEGAPLRVRPKVHVLDVDR